MFILFCNFFSTFVIFLLHAPCGNQLRLTGSAWVNKVLYRRRQIDVRKASHSPTSILGWQIGVRVMSYLSTSIKSGNNVLFIDVVRSSASQSQNNVLLMDVDTMQVDNRHQNNALFIDVHTRSAN